VNVYFVEKTCYSKMNVKSIKTDKAIMKENKKYGKCSLLFYEHLTLDAFKQQNMLRTSETV